VQPVDDVETALRTVLPVHRGEVDEVAVAEPVLARAARLDETLEAHGDGDLPGELDSLQDRVPDVLRELANLRMLAGVLGVAGTGFSSQGGLAQPCDRAPVS